MFTVEICRVSFPVYVYFCLCLLMFVYLLMFYLCLCLMTWRSLKLDVVTCTARSWAVTSWQLRLGTDRAQNTTCKGFTLDSDNICIIYIYINQIDKNIYIYILYIIHYIHIHALYIFIQQIWRIEGRNEGFRKLEKHQRKVKLCSCRIA